MDRSLVSDLKVDRSEGLWRSGWSLSILSSICGRRVATFGSCSPFLSLSLSLSLFVEFI